ncbi:uncharacterized protein LOC141702821 [Apium graveolens]|uniref:uncharacterized protein LOC141702821 n=1 Tax=Apium graveolens TaxID=4045 RepID=UPI003D79756B
MGRRHYRSSDSSSDDDDKIINNKKRGRDEQQHVEVDSDSKLTKKNVSVRDEDDKVVERDRKRDEDDEEIDRRGKSTRGDRYRDRDRDRKRVYGRDGRRYDEDRFRSSRGEDDKNGRHRSSRRRDEFDGRDGGRSRYSDGDELEEGQIRKTSEEEDDRRSELRNKRDRRDKDDVRSFTKDKGADYSKDDGRLGKGGGATNVEAPLPPPPPPPQDNLSVGRTGGVYIPPFKLARMLKQVEDKSSVEYQRLTWDALRKSINGLVNKVNATNIKNIIPELFAENLIRGRGLFCRSCIKSQMASPGFTDVFAALVAVVNTKFPQVGDLLLRRIVLQLQRAYKRNDKPQLLAAVKFIAHLVNQQIVHELVALELLTTLLENPTDDSVEVAVGFVTQCGSILQDLCPRGLHGIFERFRGILHEGEIDKRVQFLIEGLFAIRKAKFQGYPAIRPELDLVEQEDQLTHEISLLDQIDPEIALDIFKPDPQFVENEQRYEELKKTLLGEESEDEADSDAATDNEDDEEGEDDESDEEQMRIRDETETNLVNLRRTIYLTIMSSVDFEEAGHKLMKIKLEPGQEMELCIMLLECCSQERTYLRYYGLLGQRFCLINKIHQENFEKCFVQQYSMIHRLETNKLRNVAKFFAHLLGTDALPWGALAYIRLTEEHTTSSSRIFIKILFQELSEHLGIRLLNERLSDPTMQDTFESIFPRDNPKNTRFSINFFTSIGLGGITENLREYLKNMPRLIMQQQKPVSESEDDSDSTSSADSDASGSDSESGSSSSSESESESDDRKKKRRRR